MIPFVFYFNEDFLPGYKVTMRSLLLHNPWFNEPIIIYHPPGFSNEAKNQCAEMHWRTFFESVEVDNYKHINMETGKHYFRRAIWKIEIFRTQAKKIVYLDTDIAIIGDISELLTLEGDIVMSKRKGHFNSGVMVISKLGEDVYKGLLHHSNTAYRIPDQDLINAYFKGRITRLPSKYNRKRIEYSKWKEKDTRIVHYQKSKPWDCPKQQKGVWQYWHRYKDLPIVKRIAMLGSGMDADRYIKMSHLFKKIYVMNAKPVLRMMKEFPEECFKDKKIIHVVQHVKRASLGEYYEKYNITKIQSTAFKKKHFRHPKAYPYTPALVPWFMHGIGYEDYKRETSTGIFALEYALLHDCPEEIYLFGYNFYETGWYGGTTKDFNQKSIANSKKYTETLVKKFSNIQFKGASKFSVEAENWENI